MRLSPRISLFLLRLPSLRSTVVYYKNITYKKPLKKAKAKQKYTRTLLNIDLLNILTSPKPLMIRKPI